MSLAGLPWQAESKYVRATSNMAVADQLTVTQHFFTAIQSSIMAHTWPWRRQWWPCITLTYLRHRLWPWLALWRSAWPWRRRSVPGSEVALRGRPPPPPRPGRCSWSHWPQPEPSPWRPGPVGLIYQCRTTYLTVRRPPAPKCCVTPPPEAVLSPALSTVASLIIVKVCKQCHKYWHYGILFVINMAVYSFVTKLYMKHP